jgi:hypothetical protein
VSAAAAHSGADSGVDSGVEPADSGPDCEVAPRRAGMHRTKGLLRRASSAHRRRSTHALP